MGRIYKELYDDDWEPWPQLDITSGQSILKEEVEKAIQSMNKGKATGPDEISTEMVRTLDDQNIDVITNFVTSFTTVDLYQLIWSNQYSLHYQRSQKCIVVQNIEQLDYWAI